MDRVVTSPLRVVPPESFASNDEELMDSMRPSSNPWMLPVRDVVALAT
jgi:hypothetical protein